MNCWTEGIYHLLLSLRSNIRSQTVTARDIDRAPQPFLQRPLNLAESEDRGDPDSRRI